MKIQCQHFSKSKIRYNYLKIRHLRFYNKNRSCVIMFTKPNRLYIFYTKKDHPLDGPPGFFEDDSYFLGNQRP